MRPTPANGGRSMVKIECLLALGAVERFVEDAVGLDLVDVGAGDPVDAALGEQGGVEDAAGVT